MRNYATYRRVCAVVSIFGLAALAGAGCDLNGPGFGGGQIPELTEFTVSAETAVEGATLTFTVSGEDDAGVSSLNISLTGAFEDQVTITPETEATQVTDSAQVEIPTGTVSEILTAVATVTDNADSVSAPDTLTVTIQDATPPTVSASPSPASVSFGDTVSIDVTAADGRGVSIVHVSVSQNGVELADSLLDGLADTLASPVQNYSQTWQWPVPDLDVGTLTFVPSVVDVNELSATGEESSIEFGDETGPTFVSLSTVPDSTVPLADSFQVRVTVRDPAGLASVSFVGLAERGDPSMGTDSVVERFAPKTITFPRPTEADTLPKEYTLDPYLVPTDDETVEPFELLVVAEDSRGNTSDTTRAMFAGGPDVSLTSPPDSFEVGVTSPISIKTRIEDSSGIDKATLFVSGAMDTVMDLVLPAVTDTGAFRVDTTLVMDSVGNVTFQTRAWNTADIQGQSAEVTVVVLADDPDDEDPPAFNMIAERLTPQGSEDRMELLDEIRVTATALDGTAGLDSMRVDVLATRDGQQATLSKTLDVNGSNLEEELVYRVAIDDIYAAFSITDAAVVDSILPETINLQISGIAVDTVGNPSTADTALAVEAVRGTTVLLDNRDAVIADLAIDTLNDRLFMSNVTENLVEFVQLDTAAQNIALQDPVQVGSEPMGVFLGERVVSSSETSFGGLTLTAGDTVPTLLVANSGGTNLSLVHIAANAADVQEVDEVRLQKPNATLFSVAVSEDEDGTNVFQDPAEVVDMADRPQFLAQDWQLRVVYSTIGTAAADLTTVRYLHLDPDTSSTTDVPEAFFMLTTEMVSGGEGDVTNWVFGNVDDVDVQHYDDQTDLIRLISHVPGYPNQPIVTPYFNEVELAKQALTDSINLYVDPAQAALFHPFVEAGTWNFSALGWGDTTFVSASGDRTKIAIGEGASSPTGRIMLWHADPTSTYWSGEIPITDLVNNASEVVLGVGLNENGSLGVARGNEATYFFTPDLRLQGLYSQDEFGGAGAVFHPAHDELSDGGHTSTDGTGAAFTGTSENSIDVVNTFHFNKINKLVIRDNIVGPLRAGPPLADDNANLTCPGDGTDDPGCVMLKLYGITSAGGVVVLNVRRRDLE